MRILLFADIHGNAQALEAVVGDSARHGPYDLTICAGDLAWAGPRPRLVLQHVRDLCREDPTGTAGGAICLMGNCDRFLLDDFEQVLPPGKRAKRFWHQRKWMLDHLTSADLGFLRRLPFQHRVGPAPGQDLLVVHANPHNLDDPVSVDMTDEELASVIGDEEFRVLAFGHIHVPAVWQWRGRLLVNIASVGLPRDGDTRAAYSVLTWSNGRWHVAQYRVNYEVGMVAEDMRKSGLPRGEHFAKRLLAARY
ncbi:MAG: metallophosphoesterase family protein [Chloroflexota bacterium]|nr:metallophosphoesterase family protein [Chloroflexota bacterium]